MQSPMLDSRGKICLGYCLMDEAHCNCCWRGTAEAVLSGNVWSQHLRTSEVELFNYKMALLFRYNPV